MSRRASGSSSTCWASAHESISASSIRQRLPGDSEWIWPWNQLSASYPLVAQAEVEAPGSMRGTHCELNSV